MHQLDPARRMLDLQAGLIDVELLLAPAPPQQGLVVDVISSEPRYVLLAEGHPLASESSLEFEQIAGETFPGRAPGVTEQWGRDAWLSDRRGRDPKVTSETPLTLDEVWALVHAGKAISVLPQFMVRRAEGNGVRAIPLVDVEPVDVGIARREDDRRAVVLDLFAAANEVADERDAGQDAVSGRVPGG
jgi:DNA-binding transcriptional LysR family regulator